MIKMATATQPAPVELHRDSIRGEPATTPRRSAGELYALVLLAIAFIFHGIIFMSAQRPPGQPAFARAHLALDDSWIHLAYAKNLLQYGYFTYNPGQVETGA